MAALRNERNAPLFSHRATSLTDAWLPLKYACAFHWLCLARWHHGGSLLSSLLRVGALFGKVLSQFSQHDLIVYWHHRMGFQCQLDNAHLGDKSGLMYRDGQQRGWSDLEESSYSQHPMFKRGILRNVKHRSRDLLFWSRGREWRLTKHWRFHLYIV